MPLNPIVIFLLFLTTSMLGHAFYSRRLPPEQRQYGAYLIESMGFALIMVLIFTDWRPFPKWPAWLYWLTVVMIQVLTLMLSYWIRKRARRVA